MFRYLLLTTCSLLFCRWIYAQDSTYAMRLGFPDSARVLILHMDDAGMSFDSDSGIIRVFEQGVARSTSVMMPCPWVPHMARYIVEHHVDAGLHLTLTSEWKDYRWGPVAGAAAVPGLVDSTGNFWPDVADVVRHASAEEVSREIEAQLQKAERMGFHPTPPRFAHGYAICHAGIFTSLYPSGHPLSYSGDVSRRARQLFASADAYGRRAAAAIAGDGPAVVAGRITRAG